jgi:hypothetical protein
MMTHSKKLSAFCLFFTTALGAATMAGCASSADGNAEDGESSLKVDSTSMPLLTSGTSLKLERAAGAADFVVVEAKGWQQVEPGIWEHEAAGVKQQLAVDVEGHRTLIARGQQELNALYAQRDAGDSTVLPKIAQQEENLDRLGVTSQALAAPAATAAVSCNFGMYTGPSSAVTSPPLFGAAALGQIVCSGGCVPFTVKAQACCAGSCTPLDTFSNTVCATPWTAGTLRAGAGAGAAGVNVTPPNFTQTNSTFICN